MGKTTMNFFSDCLLSLRFKGLSASKHQGDLVNISKAIRIGLIVGAVNNENARFPLNSMGDFSTLINSNNNDCLVACGDMRIFNGLADMN
jgi:hypothetical protein